MFDRAVQALRRRWEARTKVRMVRLRHKIIKYCYLYYVVHLPAIPDFEFDDLVCELETLERKYPHLVQPLTPTKMTRFDESFGVAAYGTDWELYRDTWKYIGESKKNEKSSTRPSRTK